MLDVRDVFRYEFDTLDTGEIASIYRWFLESACVRRKLLIED
jgi:hypothetical protein